MRKQLKILNIMSSRNIYSYTETKKMNTTRYNANVMNVAVEDARITENAEAECLLKY